VQDRDVEMKPVSRITKREHLSNK